MTKKKLVELLSEFPDDAIVDVRCSPEDNGGDLEIEGIAEILDNRHLSTGGLWVTLGVD